MENRILKQMGRVYIFNRNREHESSTVSVLLICQRTLIGALALLFYMVRYKNLDYHQLGVRVRVCDNNDVFHLKWLSSCVRK